MLYFDKITASYSNKDVAVDSVSFQVDDSSIVGIIGPNGAGKSTFIKASLGLISASGELKEDGESLTKFQKEIAYVEQKTAIDYSFPINVEEVVELGLYSKIRSFESMKKYRKVVQEALSLVKMEEFSKRQIGELSGGQFQRVLLARTIVQNAKYIFLDEPFSGIDTTSEQIIMKQLQQFRDAGKTIFIVHHDLSRVTDYFDYVLILNKKKIAFGPTKEVFTEKNLKQAYGDSLLIGGVGG